jgi:hypothetical protein
MLAIKPDGDNAGHAGDGLLDAAAYQAGLEG